MKKITKNFFRNYLVDNGITSAVLISSPDWNGGRDYKCILNGDAYELREGLREFEYVEEVFTSEYLIKHRNDEVVLAERNNREKNEVTMCRLWQMVAWDI